MTMNVIMPVLKTFWMVGPGIIFLGIALWAYWPSNRASIEANGLIPLKNDDSEER